MLKLDTPKQLLPKKSCKGIKYKIAYSFPKHETYNICVVLKNKDAFLLRTNQYLPESMEFSSDEMVLSKDIDYILVSPTPVHAHKRNSNSNSNKELLMIQNYDYANDDFVACEPSSFLQLPLELDKDIAVFNPAGYVNKDLQKEKIAQDKKEFEAKKKRVLSQTLIAIITVGSAIFYFGFKFEAFAYFIGGINGVLYLQQLIKQIDNIENPLLSYSVGIMRFVFTAIIIATLDNIFQIQLREQPALLLWYLLGFMSFRIPLGVWD